MGRVPKGTPPWRLPRPKKPHLSRFPYNRVPWNFSRYWGSDRHKLGTKLLEENCLFFFFAGKSQWDIGSISVKNMLKKGNFYQVIEDMKAKLPHFVGSRLWIVAVEKGPFNDRHAYVYIFRYKSQITDLIKRVKVAEVMES